MDSELFKCFSMKKFAIMFFVISILLCCSTLNSTKAAPLNEFLDNSVVTIANGDSSFVTTNIVNPQSAIIDNSSMKITISSSPLGPITGGWKYTSKVGPVTSVALTMTLEYRKNFLHSWEEVGSVDFIYAGGQGLIEENEHTFFEETSKVGSYRVKFNGTITGTQGYSVVKDRVSCTVSGGGTIYMRLPNAS